MDRRQFLFSTALTLLAVPSLEAVARPTTARGGPLDQPLADLSGDQFDQAALIELIGRIATGVALRDLLAGSQNPTMRDLAAAGNERASRDTAQLRGWLKSWYGLELPDFAAAPGSAGTTVMVGVPGGHAGVTVAPSPSGSGPAAGQAPARGPAGSAPPQVSVLPAGSSIPVAGPPPHLGAGGSGGSAPMTAGGAPLFGAAASAGAAGFGGAPAPLPAPAGTVPAGSTAAVPGAGPSTPAAGVLLWGRPQSVALDTLTQLPAGRLEVVVASLLIAHHAATADTLRLAQGRAAHGELRDLVGSILGANSAESETLGGWLASSYGL